MQISLTALQSHGSTVPGQWSSTNDTTMAIGTQFVECPASRPAVPIVMGTGTKLEAVRRATIKALASYVYGLDANGEYNYAIEVPDLDFFPGKLIVKRMNAMNLVYAITEVRSGGWGRGALPSGAAAWPRLPAAVLAVLATAWLGCSAAKLLA